MATEEPLYTDHLTTALHAYPLSRILFITIKDNSQKWKIGKVNDWIRRYSDCYYIVRGTENGEHYHLIAGIEKNREVKPVKNIHFHISNLQNKKVEFYPDVGEREAERKAKHYKRERFLSQCIELDDESINLITHIKCMIEKYWKSKSNRIKKLQKQDAKSLRIQNVLVYLQKNLDEPRESDDRFRYLDWICKSQ